MPIYMQYIARNCQLYVFIAYCCRSTFYIWTIHSAGRHCLSKTKCTRRFLNSFQVRIGRRIRSHPPLNHIFPSSKVIVKFWHFLVKNYDKIIKMANIYYKIQELPTFRARNGFFSQFCIGKHRSESQDPRSIFLPFLVQKTF